MKQTLLLCVFSIILFSCKKEHTSLLKAQISGEWRYLKTVTFEMTFPLPGDSAKAIFIGSDGSFERRHNDSVLFKGTYSLIEQKDCYGDENKFLFKTSDETAEDGNYITISNDTLSLSTPNCYADGGITFYKKK